MRRLDYYLFENHYTQSRNRAKELIKNSLVLVDGEIITKPSFGVIDPNIKILAKNSYVSRAGNKLKSFLLSHPIEIDDKECLDIGSSTGGFTEVLLEEGAKRVTCVDVGKEQLHLKLRDNPKIDIYESCDIRDFRSDKLYDLITCDLSFIGSSYVLKDIDRLSSDDIIILFKPQFEVGIGVKRDKRGVVKDESAIILAQNRFEESCNSYNWNLVSKEISKIRGKEGNIEIFYHFKKV